MIQIENHIGNITVTREYLVELIECTVKNCFGVAGLNYTSGWKEFFSFGGQKKSKGVEIHTLNNQLVVDLHISVSYGINIGAVVDSITNKVRFAVNEACGITVEQVNVFIDDLYE